MPTTFATAVDAELVRFRWPDRADDADAVRLWTDLDLGDTSFQRGEDGWELVLEIAALPPVDRLEYLFEVTRDGETESVLDPGNPLRVSGAFGDHSVLELPGYRRPAWLSLEPVPGERRPLTVPGTPVGDVEVEVWSPAPGLALPLLVTHDGPEMDRLGELTRFVGAMVAGGGLPPLRVALLAPGARDERYAANPAYAEALCAHVVPRLLAELPTVARPVLMGQSLGALAALHAEWRHPGTFAGLMLQSGSFFTPELDVQESGYAHWEAVTGFVAEVLGAAEAPSAPPVAICFGSAEENAANNRQLAARLAELGFDVSTGAVRDSHTFTCWRDLLDPHLRDLLNRAWQDA